MADGKAAPVCVAATIRTARDGVVRHKAPRRRAGFLQCQSWAWFCTVLIILALGVMPVTSAAQDSGDQTGGEEPAAENAAAEEPAEEPAEPEADADGEAEEQPAEEAGEDNGDATVITKVTKTEVTRKIAKTTTKDGKTESETTSDTYIKTESSGTLPPGSGLGADEDIVIDDQNQLIAHSL